MGAHLLMAGWIKEEKWEELSTLFSVLECPERLLELKLINSSSSSVVINTYYLSDYEGLESVGMPD